jgi:hypothetical protein
MTDRQCAYLRERELVLPRLLRVTASAPCTLSFSVARPGARGAELYA